MITILIIHLLIGAFVLASDLKEFEKAADQAIENTGRIAPNYLRPLVLFSLVVAWPIPAYWAIDAAWGNYKMRRALSRVSDKMRNLAEGKDPELKELFTKLADGLKDLSEGKESER